MHEKLLKILDAVEIVRLPILADIKGYPKAALGIVTGALRTDHDVECAHEMRKSCDAILAFGVCAVYGGPQGSGYAHTLKELEDSSYRANPTTITDFVPSQGVPKLLSEGVRPIDSEIKVDLYLPGCPPHPYFVFEALSAVVGGRAPEFGPQNVCYRCNRKMSRSTVTKMRRIHQGPIDQSTCFLSQGIPCMGSATMDRCLAPCPTRGAPCTGCSGPSENIILEPNIDIRTEIATRMSMMTKIPRTDILREIEAQSKTWYAYAMASPVFRQKPTFLLRKWNQAQGAES
jgi:F420-non-reducing hydrogenase small subunit